jgi:fructose-1,6-bisphosphatase
VQILDVLSNNIMKRRLLATGLVCMMCSEEEDNPIYPEVRRAKDIQLSSDRVRFN